MNFNSLVVTALVSLVAVQNVAAQEASSTSNTSSAQTVVSRAEVCDAAKTAIARGHIQYGEATQFFIPFADKIITRKEVARQTIESIRLGFRSVGEA